ncbi:MAG: PH domain-containing protein [Proteobacteria bacterium]|nr:PH domain-containing protein [Pseudomonadota bacterium]
MESESPSPALSQAEIFQIERPAPSLLKLYILRSFLSGPLIVIVLPLLYFRYQTLRYSFDEEGVSMKWGILFRREINLTFARIQDIHLSSGVLQRWFGLADIQVQTASGSAGAEMTIEGLYEFEDVRNYLYARMRGHDVDGDGVADDVSGSEAEAIALLQEIRDELRQTREAVQSHV